jgi:hypothetical protein
VKYSSHLILSLLVCLGITSSAFAGHANPGSVPGRFSEPNLDGPPLSNSTVEEASWLWLTQQADRLDGLISLQMTDRTTHNLLKTDCERSQAVNYHEQALLAEADIAKKDLGLYFDAGIQDEWDRDFESEEKQRAYVGLTWRVLEDGYREYRHRAKLAETRAESESLQSKLDLRHALETCRYDTTRDSFAPVWLPLLSLKESFLSRLFDMQKESYLMGGLYLDDLLDSQRELKSLLEHYRILQSGLERQTRDSIQGMPPLLDLNMAEIRQRIDNDPTRKRLSKLKHSILDEQSLSNDEKKLRFYLRYNFKEDREDNGTSVGAAFSMPLAASRYSGPIVNLQKKSIEQAQEEDRRKRLRRSELAYGELLEQRQRVIKQNYRYLAAYEQLRRTIGRHQWLAEEGGFKHAVARMTTLIESAVELLRAVEEMYRRVHSVFARSGVAYSPELIELSALKNSFYRAREGSRSIYIWSDSFNRLHNGVILGFLRAKGISEVILSGSERVNEKKMARFLAASEQKDIQVQMLVGDNSWLHKTKQKLLYNRLERLIRRTGYLHLDVEPHTLDDFKKNRRDYLDQYQQLITSIDEHIEVHGKLAVSVPLHWDRGDYEYLDQQVDRIYLMAYEISSADRLQQQLAKVMPHLSVEKVVVALRPEDFIREGALEAVIEQLASVFGIKRFALHDLENYLELSDGQ